MWQIWYFELLPILCQVSNEDDNIFHVLLAFYWMAKKHREGTHWRIELINLLEMLTPHRPCENGRQIHTMSRWNSAHGICSWKHKNWAAHCSGSYKMLDLWYWLHQTLQKPQWKFLKKHAWNAISHSGHTSSRDTLFVQWAVSPSRKRSEAFRLVSMNGDHASNNLVWGLILWQGEQ